VKELIEISSALVHPQIESCTKILLSVVKTLTNGFTLRKGKEKFEELIHKNLAGYTVIEDLGINFNNPLPYKIGLIKAIDEKKLSRKYRTDLFPDSESVCVSRKKTYFLIAHLTPADLSMLSDFEEITEELSIVNGSFVTLGKPIEICNRTVHIRDTMLLAPGGSKSLSVIGRLYGEDFNKLQISSEDL
jgi:hypothetical protein